MILRKKNIGKIILETASIKTVSGSNIEKSFNTLLANQSDALLHSQRIKSLFGVQRKLYKVSVKSLYSTIEIGDTVTLKVNRFNLDAGQDFLVVGIGKDVETNTVELGCGMSNILMARPLSDSATLIGTTALGNDNVISNLQKRELSSIYRTSLVSEINIDMGAATEIDFIALVGHNGQGTVTIKAGTTAAVSDYTSGALDLITGTDYGLDKNMFAAKITAQTYRYWKLEIDDTGNADGYFQAGRMYLSKSFQPIINADYGLKKGLLIPRGYSAQCQEVFPLFIANL